MFFRREKPQEQTFESRLANLKQFKFATTPDPAGGVRVTRQGLGAVVEDLGHGSVKIGKAGLLVGGEIATLVNHGYQMFFTTPSGREIPALAPQLTALHAFDEDLREGLGLTSLYNLSLGTTTDEHLYDRIKDRDQGVTTHPWDKKPAGA